MKTTMEKLTALRALMKEKGIGAYIIYNGDAHASEYVAGYWKSRTWISGFTGSSGLVVVTENEAGLWTDGRYFIQAEKQLEGSGIDLYKMDMPGVPTYLEFIADKLPGNGKLGFDGRVVDVNEYGKIEEVLENKNIACIYNVDLIEKIWTDRPAPPMEPAFEHELRFAGVSAGEKLAAVREEMAKHNATAYLVTALDSIAWLMNIRGNDMPFTPVVYAYAVVTKDDAHVFVDKSKVENIAVNLKSQGFAIHDYDKLAGFLGQLEASGTLIYDQAKTSVLLEEAIPMNMAVVNDLEVDIIMALKAVRTPGQLKNIRNAYLKEGVALVRLLKWLEEYPDITTLTEGDIARQITHFREGQADFLQDGFSTIAAIGANAAQAHYSPGPVGDNLKAEGFLLIDTGAQYLDGTTDTTRTIPVGPITDEMKVHFTLVLKGYMGLARAVFPEGTTGTQLDVLARGALWEHGLDFRHGTGHGIGYCLGVHEGPQNISKKSSVPLVPGMMISNEPAFYVAGEYGIRTENIEVVEKRAETEYGAFYGFETLMYCPIASKAVDISLLNPAEVKHFNDYHSKTYEILSPYLKEDEVKWLYNATRPIG